MALDIRAMDKTLWLCPSPYGEGRTHGECRRRQEGVWGLVPNGGCGQSPTVLNPFRGKLPNNFGITCYTILNYGSSTTILEGNFNMGWG